METPEPHVPASPADRLRARSEHTDRADRFQEHLAQVEVARRRRRRVAVVLAVGRAVLGGAGAVLAVLVVGAVTGADAPGGLVLGAGVLGVALVPVTGRLTQRLAGRRGAQAWDWHRERYVLFGDPSRRVRDADGGGAGRPLPPGAGRP